MAWFAIYVTGPALVGEPGWTIDDLYSVGEEVANDVALGARGLAKSELPKAPDFEREKWDKPTKTFVPITDTDREARKTPKQKNVEALEAVPNWNATDEQKALRFVLGLLADGRFGRP